MISNLLAPRLRKFVALTVMAGYLVTSLTLASSRCWGQEKDKDFVRPAANKILPEETVLYARIPSFPAFFEEFGKSGFAKMVQDDRVAPFLESVYGDLKSEYDEKLKENIGGVTLEEFKDFATGELCFAMIAKRRKSPTMVMFFDVPEESQTLDKLLGVAEENGVEKGDVELEESHGVSVNYFNFEGMKLLHFRVGNTVFFCNDESLCQELVANIHGKPLEKTRTFDKNRKYRSIMGTCKVTPENPALLSFFVDPIALTKSSLRGNPAGFMVMGALPILGLDGILGIGGATLKGDEDFESVGHTHVLMANPRKGILQAVSLKKTSFDLHPIVPADAGFVISAGLDVPKLYNGIRNITDTFNGKDFFEKQMEQASDQAGFDVKTEIIDQFNGEVTIFNWADPESEAFNSNSNAYMIGYHDKDKAIAGFEKLRERMDEGRENSRFTEKKYSRLTYYIPAGQEERRERRRKFREEREKNLDPEEREARQRRRELQGKVFRSPTVAFIFLEKHLVIADNENLIKHIIDTAKGKVERLSDTEDYQKVRKQCEKMLKGQKPSGFVFSRPHKQLGPIWDLLKKQSFKDLVQDAADRSADNEDASIVRKFRDTLENHELPSFEEFRSNFAAQGGYILDEGNGLHFFTFGLKPNLEEK